MSGQQDYDVLVKAVIVGDSGVGKTCLLSSYIAGDGGYSTEYIATIGIDFKVDMVECRGKKVKLQLWDTAGQERFRTIGVAYYRGANTVLLVYDLTSRESFDHIVGWVGEIRKNAQPGIPMFLVANKCDLKSQRAVSQEEGLSVAREIDATYVETSAKTAEGVRKCFLDAVDKTLATQLGALEEEAKARKSRMTEPTAPESQKSCLQRFKFLLGL
eukprot:TRINITY_DN16109_c0_g1_i1.p1 TRINITY_DN16109_c0_g1~~TRINITY_DN16109_c0_g1_i1.p1  ORF type:complete len:240 (+),score=55.38 TRINITY_DN16109_c0_g1_i1:78-722(+)